MKKKIILLWLTLILSSTSLLAAEYGFTNFGELKYPKNFQHYDYVNPDAPKGGSINFGVVGNFDSLNPFILQGSSATGLSMTYETLMTKSADEPAAIYGLVAKDIKVANDNSSVIFNLRKEAKWHDGLPIKADDLVFSFDLLKNKAHPAYRIYLQDIAAVEKITPYKIKYIFSNKANIELPIIVATLPILSKKYYTENQFEKPSLQPFLASGAYKVKDAKAGKYIIYERVKDYWGKGLAVNKGRYNFAEIKYSYYRDSTVAVRAFKAGEYDFRNENIAKNWANEYNIEQVTNGEIIKEKIPHQIPSGMQAFAFNLRRANFQNRNVRKALSYAFDFQWTNKNLFFSEYSRTESYFANSVFASDGLPSKAELKILKPFRADLADEIFTKAFTLPTTSGDDNNRQNLIIARDILKKEGWHVKNMQLINPETNQPVKIEFMVNSPSFQRVILPIIKNLKKLGVSAEIRMVDDSQYQKRLESFDFDVVVHIFSAPLIPGNEQLSYWHSSKKDVRGSSNIVGVDNSVIDKLVERLVTERKKAGLTNVTKALDRVLLNNYYVIPQWHLNSFRLLYWNKFQRPKTSPLYDIGIDNWWSVK